MEFIKQFTQVSLHDIAQVGGKNASLGEMIINLKAQDITVPLGFALVAQAYWYYLDYNNFRQPLATLLAPLKIKTDIAAIQQVGAQARALITSGVFPPELYDQVAHAYNQLSVYYGTQACDVAVRSSATAEDLPNASFAGQQETYLHVVGLDHVIKSSIKCMASLFTDRAIAYRQQHNFEHFQVAMSVGVQKMVRSDLACSGVMFTLDTESGYKDAIMINASYGLGESIVQGTVNPDEFHVHKPTLIQGFRPIIKKYLGTKKTTLIYSKNHKTKQVPVKRADQQRFCLTDDEILQLARYAISIEQHYSTLKGSWTPMDIEWAKDGLDNRLYIIQARPETVHSRQNPAHLVRYHLDKDTEPQVLVKGHSIGEKITSGTARIFKTLHDIRHFNTGDILITTMTDPDWVPYMKKAGAIVTNEGGRTCHAAIVSRELGIPAIVGTGQATSAVTEGQGVTVDCSQGSVGYVYAGQLTFTKQIVELTQIPEAPVPVMLNMADPDRAFELSFLPVAGVGLARIEFIITNAIKIHPMAAACPEQITSHRLRNRITTLARGYESWRAFYVQTLAQGIATIAAAFYPRPIIVRLADFKSNEYRNLLGGSQFEPREENPMLGWRGASRYCDPAYAPAFALECEALLQARNSMGMYNIKIMVPFVRTLEEAACTLKALETHGIARGSQGLELYMMCEIPSNVLLLEQFSRYFDGFSIGSNDLTQLTLALDRDSALLSTVGDERDPAVHAMLALALDKANALGIPIGICGQAPSDFPEIAEFLIAKHINSLSLNADSVIPFLLRYKPKS